MKKVNQIAASIALLAIVLIVIFADRIFVNLSAMLLIISAGLMMAAKSVLNDFHQNPQLDIGLTIFLFLYLIALIPEHTKNTKYLLFCANAIPVPISYLISIVIGLKKFSWAEASSDLFLTGWMGICMGLLYGFLAPILMKNQTRYFYSAMIILGWLFVILAGFLFLNYMDTNFWRPDLLRN